MTCWQRSARLGAASTWHSLIVSVMRAAIAVLACAAVALGLKVPITKRAITMTDLKSGRASVSRRGGYTCQKWNL